MPDLLLIGTAPPRQTEMMEAAFTVHTLSKIEDVDAFLTSTGEAIEYVFTNGHDGVPKPIFDRLPNLKIIASNGVGYDAIDTDAANARGIIVTHTPNVLNADVANTAILLLLAVSRNLINDDAYARSGDWERDGNAPLTRSIEGSKVGILGLGRIGETIARKLGAFDCDVSYHSRSPKDVPYRYVGNLVEMAREVDALICITPGGPATEKLVNAEVMEALGPSGILINVARGSVVDEAALIDALQSGKLGFAGLDVFEREPHIPDALKAMSTVTLMPHAASATVETRQAMGDLTVNNLLQFLKDGTALTPVPECQ